MLLLHSSQRFEHRANFSCENREVTIDAQTSNQSTRKRRSSTTWSAAGVISLPDLEQHYGKSREEAAESLQVSVSTFKRTCRKYGISRWPPAKSKRGKCFLAARELSASLQVGAGEHASTSQSPNAFTSALQSLASSPRVIESPQQLVLSSTSVSSPSYNKNTAQSSKLLFNNLIMLPLEDLIDPKNESSLKETLSVLSNNLSLFSDEQARRIIELKLDFPTLVQRWREYSRSQMHNHKFIADLEKARNVAETSAKDEESLKVRCEELESKEKELMAQLKTVQKEKAGVAEQRNEKSEQTKYLVSLAQEKAGGRTKDKHLEMTIASAKLACLLSSEHAGIMEFLAGHLPKAREASVFSLLEI